MVLRGKLRGRVGSRRDYLTQKARSRVFLKRAFALTKRPLVPHGMELRRGGGNAVSWVDCLHERITFDKDLIARPHVSEGRSAFVMWVNATFQRGGRRISATDVACEYDEALRGRSGPM